MERPVERHEPEEKAKQPQEGAPEFANVSGVPDPSGDTEITQEDRDNPMVNDGSFEDEGDRDR